VVRLFAPPPPPAAFFVAAPPPPPPPFEYYAAVATGGGARFGPPAEQDAEAEQPPRDGSFDDPVPKIRKQVGGYDRCSYITRSGIEFAQFATFFIVSQAVYVIRCAS
jgi:hypothetical protein